MKSDSLTLIQNKTANVVVVSASPRVRSEISASLRSIGFANLHPAADLSDLKQISRNQRLDWIIAAACISNDFDILSAIEFTREEPLLRSAAVSLFLDESELECLPTCFEQGLTSFHINHFARTQILENFNAFLDNILRSGADATLLAALYLRQHLRSKNQSSAMIDLEMSLIDLQPGNPRLLLNLAEAKVFQKKYEDAVTILAQAQFLDASLSQDIADIYNRIKSESQFAQNHRSTKVSAGGTASPPAAMKAFPLDKCIIVDNDSAAVRQNTSLLKELGITDVQAFYDGQEAWEWFKKNEEPSLIIQEWKLPKISGLALVQKLREIGYRKAPLIVTSSLVKPEDGPLLKEMSISTLLPKPFARNELLLALRWAFQQHFRPSEQTSLEKRIDLYLRNSEIDKARELKTVYMADRKISESRKMLMKAQFLFYQGDLIAAKETAMAATKISGVDSLAAVNLIGKCFIKMGDQKAAIKCFELADKCSPNNIARICDMSEMYLDAGEFQLAENKLAKAHHLDTFNDRTLSLKLKLALTIDDTDRAQHLMLKVKSKTDIISYMNNKAVALIKSGKSDEGISLYKRTIAALPKSEPELIATVHYNLGLAYTRLNQLNESLLSLNVAVSRSNGSVHSKAKSLAHRVESAIQSGESVALSQEFPETTKATVTDLHDIAVIKVSLVSAGEFGLWKIFRNNQEIDSFTKQLISNPRKKSIA